MATLGKYLQNAEWIQFFQLAFVGLIVCGLVFGIRKRWLSEHSFLGTVFELM